MRWDFIAVAALAIVSVTAADGVLAQDASATQEMAEDRTTKIFETYDQALSARRFGDALAAANMLNPDRSNKSGQAIAAAMKASALLGMKRNAEAEKLIAVVDELDAQEPFAASELFTGALIADRWDIAATALDKLIARFPDAVREVDPDHMFYFLRNEPKDGSRANEDRRIDLARIGYQADTPTGDFLAAGAIGTLMKRGDASKASELLRYVDEPQAIENMLIQKRFQPLWPALEARAGVELADVRTSSVESAARAYAAAPNDHEQLAHYANALRHAGRHDDAIALRAKLPSTMADMAKADEQLGWVVNNVALALHERGRGDEADQLFALLNDAPMPEEAWRVSMKINRLELLVIDGKYDAALPLIEPTAKVKGSEYADQLVRRLRYCTLSGLGRKQEAAKYLPDLLKHADDAPGPTIDGLLCAGEIDRAEQLALTTLKSSDKFDEDFVRSLQVRRLTSDDPSVWQERWDQLRARPAIRAEFDRLGRDMPQAFVVPSPRSN